MIGEEYSGVIDTGENGAVDPVTIGAVPFLFSGVAGIRPWVA